MAVYHDPASMVDLDRYPITDLDTLDARECVERCRRALDDDGALSLAGFIRPEAASMLAAEARELAPLAYEISTDHTCYFEPAEDGYAPHHPRRRLLHSVKGGVAGDYIDADAMLQRLYRWDPLMEFIVAVLGEEQLYRHADPLASLNINVFSAGQNLNWHFDRTDFSVTLSIEVADQGGEFEYVPGLRNADDENYDGVTAVMEGARDDIRVTAFAAGALALFRGHHALHRVTPVAGPRARLAAVLSYVRKPEVTFTPYARELFYGRSGEADG